MCRPRTASSSAAPAAASGGRTSRRWWAISSRITAAGRGQGRARGASAPQECLHPPRRCQYRPAGRAGLLRRAGDGAVPYRPRASPSPSCRASRPSSSSTRTIWPPAQPLAEIYRRAGVPVLVTSAETGEGIEALRAALAGKLSCLTGNSGVGKSSLLNRACPGLQLPVGEVSGKLGRGRHTTRHVELRSLGRRYARKPPIRRASPRSTPSGWSWCTRSSCSTPSRSSPRTSATASSPTAPTGKSPAAPVRKGPRRRPHRPDPLRAATSACTSWPAR